MTIINKNMEKYKLTKNSIKRYGKKLFQIKANIDFGAVKKGELGGYIEKLKNLDQVGDAWVYGDACVYGNARVYGDACVYGNARVYGDARVYSDAWVYGDACVYGDAWVYGDACVYGDVRVFGNARVYGDACVYGDAWVYGDACVYGDVRVFGNARVYGDACVYGRLKLELGYYFGMKFGSEKIKEVDNGNGDKIIWKK